MQGNVTYLSEAFLFDPFLVAKFSRFVFSWTRVLCVFKLAKRGKLRSHWSQKCQSPSCVDCMCLLRIASCRKLFSQMLQLNFLQAVDDLGQESKWKWGEAREGAALLRAAVWLSWPPSSGPGLRSGEGGKQGGNVCSAQAHWLPAYCPPPQSSANLLDWTLLISPI